MRDASLVSRALLLGLLGLGAAGAAWWPGAPSAPGPRSASPSAARAGVREAALAPLVRDGEGGERYALAADSGADLARSDRDAARRARPALPGSERAALEAWLALAADAPGALERRAPGVLAQGAPATEQVALLRALVETGSPEASRWLAHAASTLPDDPGARGRSVAGTALALLAERAAVDPLARAGLRAIAFEAPGAGAALRRRAASAYALRCEDFELSALRRALLAERDALLVAGVAASLAERAPTPALALVRADVPLVE